MLRLVTRNSHDYAFPGFGFYFVFAKKRLFVLRVGVMRELMIYVEALKEFVFFNFLQLVFFASIAWVVVVFWYSFFKYYITIASRLHNNMAS